MGLLEITQLTLRFHGADTPAVDDLSLSIAAGETLAIVGESGSGKTMTALSVARLGPEEALEQVSGTLRLNDLDILQADATALRTLRGEKIGIVFQDPTASLNPLMTVGGQVREALADGAALDALLAEVGLGDVPGIAGRYPHELSGGQQQRIGIAMAVAGNPDLLIADEPTTALDVTVQAQILDLFAKLKAQRGMAMLFISHDFGVVARLADRILVMRHGKLVETGPASQILRIPSADYTRALLACRPRLAAPPDRLPTLTETPPAVTRPKPGNTLLEVDGLSVIYPPKGLLSTAFTAVRASSFDLRAGEALGIVGESGSGKSSLAKAIVGLAPLSGGQIRYQGQRWTPTGLSKEQRRKVQYIFQDNYGSLNPRHTVRDLVREGLDLHAIGSRQSRDATVLHLLAEVGLALELADRVPRELSGGQRQRVAIARALALEPEVLICDEIVSALDVSVQAQVLNLLKDLMSRRGLAIVFISHDLAVIRFVADRVIVMQQGEIVEHGPAREVVEAPQKPYTSNLAAAARAIELH